MAEQMRQNIVGVNDNISDILDELKELEMLTKGFEDPEMLKQLALKKTRRLLSLYEEMEFTASGESNAKKEETVSVASVAPKVETVAEKAETPSIETNLEITTEKIEVGTPSVSEEKTVETANIPVAEERIETTVATEKKPQEQKTTPSKQGSGNFSRMESQFVKSLKSAIKLNDRIRYKKELFDNDMLLLDRTIEELDKQSCLEDAMTYVHRHFLHWDNESEAVEDFLTLLEKRFSNK